MLALYAHPFSSYCQKVQIALYEHGVAFDYKLLDPEHPANGAEFARRWPLKKMPLLVDRDRDVVESSVIIEYLDTHYAGAHLLVPADPRAALEARKLDRIFDNYVMTPMQRIVFDFIRAPKDRDPAGVADMHALLDTAYRWLDGALAGRTWAAGEAFTLADCAAAPALFYADWVHPIDPGFARLRAFRTRLNARPSVARCIEEARPYRKLFPPGAPDRD
jgi:glutathione S-transferase